MKSCPHTYTKQKPGRFEKEITPKSYIQCYGDIHCGTKSATRLIRAPEIQLSNQPELTGINLGIVDAAFDVAWTQ